MSDCLCLLFTYGHIPFINLILSSGTLVEAIAVAVVLGLRNVEDVISEPVLMTFDDLAVPVRLFPGVLQV